MHRMPSLAVINAAVHYCMGPGRQRSPGATARNTALARNEVLVLAAEVADESFLNCHQAVFGTGAVSPRSTRRSNRSTVSCVSGTRLKTRRSARVRPRANVGR
jgi:hypothetical protein